MSRGNRILLVDDDRAFLRRLGEILKGAGYQVIKARTGIRAIELIERLHTDVDLAVIDLVLPGELSGFDVIGFLSRDSPDIKILAASALFREPQMYLARRLGAQDTVEKPADSRDLSSRIWLATVRRILEESEEQLAA